MIKIPLSVDYTRNQTAVWQKGKKLYHENVVAVSFRPFLIKSIAVLEYQIVKSVAVIGFLFIYNLSVGIFAYMLVFFTLTQEICCSI